MYRHIYIYIYKCAFMHICMYTTGQLTCCRPTRTAVGRAMRLRCIARAQKCGVALRVAARAGAGRRGTNSTCVHTCIDIFIYMDIYAYMHVYNRAAHFLRCRGPSCGRRRTSSLDHILRPLFLRSGRRGTSALDLIAGTAAPRRLQSLSSRCTGSSGCRRPHTM